MAVWHNRCRERVTIVLSDRQKSEFISGDPVNWSRFQNMFAALLNMSHLGEGMTMIAANIDLTSDLLL